MPTDKDFKDMRSNLHFRKITSMAVWMDQRAKTIGSPQLWQKSRLELLIVVNKVV